MIWGSPPHHPPTPGAAIALHREDCPELTGGPARGRQGRPGAESPGNSWRRVGETQTHHRAWSSFLPGVAVESGTQRETV